MEQNKSFFDAPPKTMFTFGIALGIVVCVVVFAILGGFNVERDGGDTVAEDTAPVVDNSGTPSVAGVPGVTDADHIIGDIKKAKVVMIEYSDYQCSYCESHHPTLEALAEEYGDDVAWVYRHFPLNSIHPQATPSAMAAECAGEQGKFWEMTEELFANQATLSTTLYDKLAGDLGLDMEQYNECFTSGKYLDKIEADQQGGVAAGVTGTPATFINGTLYKGVRTVTDLQPVIEAAL